MKKIDQVDSANVPIPLLAFDNKAVEEANQDEEETPRKASDDAMISFESYALQSESFELKKE